YRFRHALISEAVRNDQLPGERAAAHRRFARALAADPGLAANGSGSAELAFHWHEAGDASQALAAGWQTAGDAEARLAYAERLDMLERVLELWARVPDAARCIGCGRPSVLDAAVAAAADAGEFERGVALATAALAEAEGDPVRTARLLGQRAPLLSRPGRDGALADLHAAGCARACFAGGRAGCWGPGAARGRRRPRPKRSISHARPVTLAPRHRRSSCSPAAARGGVISPASCRAWRRRRRPPPGSARKPCGCRPSSRKLRYSWRSVSTNGLRSVPGTASRWPSPSAWPGPTAPSVAAISPVP